MKIIVFEVRLFVTGNIKGNGRESGLRMDIFKRKGQRKSKRIIVKVPIFLKVKIRVN